MTSNALPSTDTLLSIGADLVKRARARGASAAEAIVVEDASLGISVRLGALEDVERSESRDLGVRVFFGQRQASVSSTDLSAGALDEALDRAVAMARLAPEDPYAGLAEPDLIAKEWPDLDLEDPDEPDAARLEALARDAEAAGRDQPGITNSEGGGASWGRYGIALVTSNGFAGAYRATSWSLHCSLLAGEGTGMERDYEYSSARHSTDLKNPAWIGSEAARKAVARLNPRKVKSGSMPVIFDPRVSGGLVGHLASAISGTSIARGTSFLKDRLGQQIFPEGISIVDEPHRPRGLKSRPFDGEGVASERLVPIANGVLTGWIMDCASARQLGLKTSGRASRGIGGPPHPSTTNLYMEPGKVGRAALIGDVNEGLYVTELIGMGVNGVTGDYSRGAAGFRIEKGELTHPVSEVTVASNLKTMFARIAAADDLEFRGGTNAPTLRVDGMTIAGN